MASTNNALLIPVERNAAMSRAIERAKQHHPKVSIVSVENRTYCVQGSKGGTYTVSFHLMNGHKLAQCNCEAGKQARLCYHVAAAAAVNMGAQAMRQANQTPAQTAPRKVTFKMPPTLKGEKYGSIDI